MAKDNKKNYFSIKHSNLVLLRFVLNCIITISSLLVFFVNGGNPDASPLEGFSLVATFFFGLMSLISLIFLGFSFQWYSFNNEEIVYANWITPKKKIKYSEIINVTIQESILLSFPIICSKSISVIRFSGEFKHACVILSTDSISDIRSIFEMIKRDGGSFGDFEKTEVFKEIMSFNIKK